MAGGAGNDDDRVDEIAMSVVKHFMEKLRQHPTYRGAIETITYAGFREVIEIVGTGKKAVHPLYSAGQRRCFLAIK